MLLWIFTGYGFGSNDTNVEVRIGSVSCCVESVSNTEITCVTESTSQTHHIDNKGSHPIYGEFYAWNPSLLIVEVMYILICCL